MVMQMLRADTAEKSCKGSAAYSCLFVMGLWVEMRCSAVAFVAWCFCRLAYSTLSGRVVFQHETSSKDALP